MGIFKDEEQVGLVVIHQSAKGNAITSVQQCQLPNIDQGDNVGSFSVVHGNSGVP